MQGFKGLCHRWSKPSRCCRVCKLNITILLRHNSFWICWVRENITIIIHFCWSWSLLGLLILIFFFSLIIFFSSYVVKKNKRSDIENLEVTHMLLTEPMPSFEFFPSSLTFLKIATTDQDLKFPPFPPKLSYLFACLPWLWILFSPFLSFFSPNGRIWPSHRRETFLPLSYSPHF